MILLISMMIENLIKIFRFVRLAIKTVKYGFIVNRLFSTYFFYIFFSKFNQCSKIKLKVYMMHYN